MAGLYAEKRVNYSVFDGEHRKNTAKNNVFEGFFVYMFVFSRVWGDKGIGNIVKKDVLERFYGDKCVNYRALKENHANTVQKTRDLEDFVEKNADNGAKCRLDSFSGHRRAGYLKFPSLGGPHAGEKIKKHPLGGSQGGEIAALDGPRYGWLRSFLK